MTGPEILQTIIALGTLGGALLAIKLGAPPVGGRRLR